ncbi:MAG: hypothetical protein JSU74_04070 [Candidatus Zixiibacteriota bacterium]|nr:MAG: hypothetical protein JSU74_04070 [candidate division Zixibacteria bacterium]
MYRTFLKKLVICITLVPLHSSVIGEPYSDLEKSTATPLTLASPNYQYAVHDVGNITLTVSNYGRWGVSYIGLKDCFTGEVCGAGSEFPKGSLILHLFQASLWVGGVINRDTAVSRGGWVSGWSDRSTAEEYFNTDFEPDPRPFGGIERRSIDQPASTSSERGVSNQDFIATYADTASLLPLNVKVSQKSYAWSSGIAADFVLFDISVENIGSEIINDAYIGISSRPEVSFSPDFPSERWSICGFLRKVSSPVGCGLIDTLNLMWGASTDGDPVAGEFTETVVCPDDCYRSSPDAHGYFFLDYPQGRQYQPTGLAYNWWAFVSDFPNIFGPQHREGYREFRDELVPSEPDLYHIMRNGEIDYDILYTASIGANNPIWLPPPQEDAELLSTRGAIYAPPNLISVGPFDIGPGSSVSTPFAFVCGRTFHTDPNNAENLPYSITAFYSNLDFSSLVQTATRAKWVYDNPGVDTDGDEYAGEFVVCNSDTIYHTGDGVPDWRAAMPPAPPAFWLEPVVNGIRVRFNGTRTENEPDLFSHLVDFEGYHVYIGLDRRASSMALAASYDRENFDKYVYTGHAGSAFDYTLFDPPYSPDSLRCLYGSAEDPCQDTLFNPLSFTRATPYLHPEFPDSIFYFVPHDHNASIYGVTTPFSKVYPDQPHPDLYHPDSIPAEAYTAEGYLKYYEYEFVFEDLLATVPYCINVTAFDFGQPDLQLKGLESSVTGGIKSAFPLTSSDAAAGGNAKVYVYPNPYRGDAGYRDLGFEGRMEDDRPDYRVRAINFGNLPPKCTIYIYSLDGDLVRKLDHDMDPSDPNCGHDSWNMITRNTQMVVSGLYYWVVESEDGSTQMGKLVIIM